MKNAILFLLIMLTFFGFAQNNNIEQFSTKRDSVIKYFNVNIDTAFVLATELKDFAILSNNDSLIAVAYKTYGKACYLKNNFNNAVKYFNYSINLYSKLNDTSQVILLLNNLGIIYSYTDEIDSCLFFHKKALKLAEKSNNKTEFVETLNNIGTYYLFKAEYKKAINYYKKAINTAKQLNYEEGLSAALNNLGATYQYFGKSDSAIIILLESLKLYEKKQDSTKIYSVYENIAILYSDIGFYDKAIDYESKVFNYSKRIKNNHLLLLSINNLSTYYSDIGKDSIGLKMLLDNINIIEITEDKKLASLAYKNIGSYYGDNKQYDKAIEYYKKAISIRKQFNSVSELYNIYIVIAELYTNKGDAFAGKAYIDKIKITNNILTDKYFMKKYYQIKSMVYAGINNKSAAYDYLYKYILLRDSLHGQEVSKQISNLEAKYQTEKKEKQILKQKTELEKSKLQTAKEKAEKEKQQVQRNLFILAFCLMIILALIVYRSYKQKQKANILLAEQKHEIEEKNEELNQLLEEVSAQRDEIERQKNEIERIHHEVSQSISYAKRIQQSILPAGNILSKYFADYFVFFKPKDIVSGDFYWTTHIENQTIITVADCTGHGVPGAFMSMLGASFLREIVEKEYITHTGVILRKLRKEIIKALKQKGVSGEQKDGMDMAIISINHETNVVQFSGANNPLYIVKSGELKVKSEMADAVKEFEYDKISTFKLYELRPDKMPIAIYERMENFTTHEIQLKKGDCLYMFSDGFADQFGGEKGKKFKYKPFKKLIIDNCELTMAEQKQILEQTFSKWTYGYEQVDDVAVMGIRI